MQLWQYCLLVTAKLLYMFRTLSAPSPGVLKTVEASTGACHGCMPCPRSVATAVATNLGHPYWTYIFPTHGMHQWLLLQF